MKRWRKWIATGAVVVAAFGLGGCGDPDDDTADEIEQDVDELEDQLEDEADEIEDELRDQTP